MRNTHWLILSAVLAVIASGCGQSTGTRESATATDAAVAAGGAKLEAPAAAAYEFLDAVRTGNDEKARKMLSVVAREKTAALNRSVTPAASDTAKFTVGKVEYVNQDGARVESTWTDVDDSGQAVTDEAIWVLRLEEEGWRVAGVAAQVFPGERPLLLNFEDPEEMLRNQRWAQEEMRKRQEAEAMPVQGAENQEKPLRR